MGDQSAWDQRRNAMQRQAAGLTIGLVGALIGTAITGLWLVVLYSARHHHVVPAGALRYDQKISGTGVAPYPGRTASS